ncbi:MAG: alpha/beta hydrolase family protein [Gemmatimonadaceae bacterium]
MNSHSERAQRSRNLQFVLVAGLLVACSQPYKLTKDDSPMVLGQQAIQASNPGLPGPLPVKTLFYGSGTDKRRVEYRDSVKIKTKAVDGTPFIRFEGAQSSERKKRWGIEVKQLPINGRVWYPDGPGPYPLVLVVHGNHNPYDYSDPGYDYLGELLASRGFILVSVDENFINGISNENDGRGWMLLEHFRAWKAFTDSASNPFYGKVDWQNLAVMGHSRGGEAVGHAVTFNRLARYPDDANVKLGYHFNIKAAVAIAPVDGQYRPTGRFHPFTDVNYLVIHGSHDGDVSSFHGARIYERLRYTDTTTSAFKSAIYMYRANHGQWNSVWQNMDNGKTSARRLALGALVPLADQLQFGRVVISAFLEATLKGRREYLPLFVDHRTAGQWLPKTMYITRFQDSRFVPLATFEDDVDVYTGVPGVTISGDSLSTWNENVIPFRSAAPPGAQGDLQNNSAVWLGWNNLVAGPDTTRRGKPARYTLTLSDSLRNSLHLGDGSALVLSLAPTGAIPGKRAAPKDTTKKDSTAAKTKAPKPPKPPPPPKDTVAVDFTVEVEDTDGNIARVPLSQYGAVRRPLFINVLRRERMERNAFRTRFEIVPQSYVIPFADFRRLSSRFSAAKLKAVRFVFDRVDGGTVIVDGIGVSNIDPAFLGARLKNSSVTSDF